jgi:hypothetical protein
MKQKIQELVEKQKKAHEQILEIAMANKLNVIVIGVKDVVDEAHRQLESEDTSILDELVLEDFSNCVAENEMERAEQMIWDGIYADVEGMIESIKGN